ncbi:MAG: plasmid mobilization relaxosome protein MobC [Clostridia bacterium]
MKEMRAIGNNLNQIARKAHSLNFIDELLYRKEAEKWN